MPNDRDRQADDLLDRLTGHWRHADAPAEMPDRVAASILRAVNMTEHSTKERILTMLWKTRYPSAAAAVIIAAVVGWLMIVRAEIAFADVIENIRNVQSYSAEVEEEQQGQRVRATVIVKGAKYKREQSDGLVSIADLDLGKGIILNPATKSVVIHHLEKQKDRLVGDLFLERIQRFEEATTENLGIKEIDGQRVKGFRAALKSSVGGHEEVVTAWIGVESGLPHRLEYIDPKTGRVTSLMHNFVWNPPIDDSIFDLTPPAGYTVHEPAKARDTLYDNKNENDVVQSLRLWATYNGRVFPDAYSVKAYNEVVQNLPMKHEFGTSTQVVQVVRGLSYALLVESRGEWHYAGKGVKLGEADKPVAWWRATKDAETYRMLYGNLTIRDVKPEDLPTAPVSPEGD